MTAVEQRDPRHDLVERIRRDDDFRGKLRMVLPENVSLDKFAGTTVTALLKSPELMEADRESLLVAITQCAQAGLMPDGNEAAIVVFNTKAKDGSWVKKAQTLPMVAGLRKIAAEYGWVIRTAIVYANDEFDYELGLNERLEHRPARFGAARGERVGAYAVAVHRRGVREFEVMDATEIEKVRQTSRAKDYGPWKDWPDRMAEKTVARRLFKKLALDPADKRVAAVISAADLTEGEGVRLLYGPRAGFADRASGVPALTEGSRADPPASGGVPSDADEGQQAAAGDQSPDPLAAAPGTDEDIPWPEDEPGPGDAATVAALEASKFVPENGKYSAKGAEGPLTLGQIAESNRGWFRWAAKSLDLSADYGRTVESFARIYAAAEWQAGLAEREAS